MRTLEDWFKYLEQQYVDEKTQKAPAQPPGEPSPTPSRPETDRSAVSSVRPQQIPEAVPREHPAPPSMLEQVQIVEVTVPDPADYIFRRRRQSNEPVTSPAAEGAKEPTEPERPASPAVEAQPAAEPAATASQQTDTPAVSEPSVTPGEGTGGQGSEGTTAFPKERPSGTKTVRRAPYARSVRPVAPPQSIEELWMRVPKHVRLLVELGDDHVTQKYYGRQFKESRQALVERLLNPPLSLEDTARLLGVCPTTVRRYTERGLLNHYRTPGNQRRFRLSDVIAFLEARQQAQESRRRKR